MKTPYPLSWPEGRPRTPDHKREKSQFKPKSTSAAISELLREINLLNGRRHGHEDTSLMISSNVTMAHQSPKDPGVAVYFKLRIPKPFPKPDAEMDIVFACDKWKTVQENITAVSKHIDAMRGQDRWGAYEMERAFSGYQALPEHAGQGSNNTWWADLGFSSRPHQLDVCEENYRKLSQVHHPDRGGLKEKMISINLAIQKAREELKKN